jgi:ABC-type spermidine/putrescine transport system permease subunit I
MKVGSVRAANDIKAFIRPWLVRQLTHRIIKQFILVSFRFLSGLDKIKFTRKNSLPRLKRFCCKISVQTIVITTVVTFLVFVLGFILNYSVKDHDKSENNILSRFITDSKTSKNVGGYKISGETPTTFATVISSTIILQNNSSTKIIGAAISAALFTVFYLTIIVCLKRRQKLQNDIQNISTNVRQNQADWTNIPVTIV